MGGYPIGALLVQKLDAWLSRTYVQSCALGIEYVFWFQGITSSWGLLGDAGISDIARFAPRFGLNF